MNQARKPKPPGWILIVGGTVGIITLIFFMILVILAIVGYEVPESSRFLVVVVLALGAALSSAFLGGYASAEGRLTIPGFDTTPFQVGFGGGLAVLLVFLIVGNLLYVPSPPPPPGIEGWIRAGAVDNPSGRAEPGAQLVERGKQPITISPPYVPKKNDRVTITNAVNLRTKPPLPPDYNLQDKIGVLRRQDRATVIDINTYVDRNTDPTFTRIWAKVKLLGN